MDHVFVVMHLKEVDDIEDVKMIGVYTTQSLAEEAILRLVVQPGFCDYVDGFSVDRYELNKDHWQEGFISWAEALEDQSPM